MPVSQPSAFSSPAMKRVPSRKLSRGKKRVSRETVKVRVRTASRSVSKWMKRSWSTWTAMPLEGGHSIGLSV